MSSDQSSPSNALRQKVASGTAWVFLAEAVILPTGLITAAVLTRRLGPSGYGLFTLVATIVIWLEWVVSALFSRASVNLVSGTTDWRPVAATVVRAHLMVSSVVALGLAALAPSLAAGFGEPALAEHIPLFALDLPIVSLAHAHRHILIGTGQFRARALMGAGRWIARLILIVTLVELGLSVRGAILGSIGASLVELAIARWHVRPSLWGATGFPIRRLVGHAIPLSLFALSMRVFDRLDLVMLKVMGRSTEDIGLYGAAQNLTVAPSLFALSFSSLLISTLSHALRAGQELAARDLARDAMRVVVVLLPFGAMTAGAAREIVTLLFGHGFATAAPVLQLGIFGAIASVMISVSTAILTAAGRGHWTPMLAGPIVTLALIGHWLLIPRFGLTGAALVTTVCASAGAFAGITAVHRLWQVGPPAATIGRSVAISIMAALVASGWSTPGPMLVVKLALIGLGTVAAFIVLGELGVDRRRILEALRRGRTPGG